jgi:hypothetical protein
MKTTAFATSIIMRNITEDGRIVRNVGAFSGKRSSRDLLKTGRIRPATRRQDPWDGKTRGANPPDMLLGK